MTILLTILMFILFIWCKSSDEKNGALIFLLLTIGGIITFIIESMSKSWTETTPKSIVLIVIIFIIVPIIYASVKNKK